ncbi:MAG: prepilin-type N-terminal cleavage/methylation domain-containing protein [Verrucomicrobiae bacterium]|nr:prepilin-type N-terminal cleavage/methylation domain-containing protein [Verrucomicrobiae bacterium]
MAFTLVELLVVICVISLLAGMLLPALKAARERAKQIQCMGNLRQVGMGLAVYASEHDDQLPPYEAQPPHQLTDFIFTEYYPTWYMLLSKSGALPLLTDWDVQKPAWKILRCPSQAVYELSGGNCCKGFGQRLILKQRMSDVKDPARCIFYADTIRFNPGGYGHLKQAYTFKFDDGGNANANYIHLRHSGAANCWFLDGHVKSCLISDLKEDEAIHAAVVGNADNCTTW